MRKILILVAVIPLCVNAQVLFNAILSGSKGYSSSIGKEMECKGIEWAEGLTFQEAKIKARSLNKYIFLDCFATWCGPCKMMDKEVYTNSAVAKYFNDHFISLRVQMDKTVKDNDQIRSWYDDAVEIARQYRVLAFPSFIFLSPNGEIVHMETGFKDAKTFLALAQMATKQGKVYDNPYAAYDRLVKEYKIGIVRYDSMVYMIKTAQKLDKELANDLMILYSDYSAKLDMRHRYTKDNITFWSLKTLKSDSKIFSFFYKEGRKIDRVMEERGFAAEIVDRTIYNELIIQFLKEQNRNKKISMTGMYMSGGGLEADSSEADWNKLYKIIRLKYEKKVAKRNVLAARIEWYRRHLYQEGVSKYLLMQLKKYPRDFKKCFFELNNQAWEVFLHSNDKELLIGYTKLIEKLTHEFPKEPTFMDTYANLLYKMGRLEEALAWEEKAVKVSDNRYVDEYKKVLKQMKHREPTYDVKPLW